jgi:iron complex outermembrane receptor protein
LLALQYNISLIPSKQLQVIIRGEWIYLGTQYFDLANTIRQSPYSLLNTRLGLKTKHAELYFWERNIANVKYIAYGYDFGAVHLGNPRTFGFTFKASM